MTAGHPNHLDYSRLQHHQLARRDMNMTHSHSSGEALTKYTSRNAAPSMMGWHDVRSQKATAGEGGGCNPDSWPAIKQAFVFVVLSI